MGMVCKMIQHLYHSTYSSLACIHQRNVDEACGIVKGFLTRIVLKTLDNAVIQLALNECGNSDSNKMQICKHGVSAQAHKAYVLTVSLSLKISLKYCIRKKLRSRSDTEQHNFPSLSSGSRGSSGYRHRQRIKKSYSSNMFGKKSNTQKYIVNLGRPGYETLYTIFTHLIKLSINIEFQRKIYIKLKIYTVRVVLQLRECGSGGSNASFFKR